MKTLDEVIQGLSVCDDVECCYACPHSNDYAECDVDWGYLTRDALHYLKEYQAILPLVPNLINTALQIQKKGKTIG